MKSHPLTIHASKPHARNSIALHFLEVTVLRFDVPPITFWSSLRPSHQSYQSPYYRNVQYTFVFVYHISPRMTRLAENTPKKFKLITRDRGSCISVKLEPLLPLLVLTGLGNAWMVNNGATTVQQRSIRQYVACPRCSAETTDQQTIWKTSLL